MNWVSQRRRNDFETPALWLTIIVAVLVATLSVNDNAVAQDDPGDTPEPPAQPEPPIDPEDLEEDTPEPADTPAAGSSESPAADPPAPDNDTLKTVNVKLLTAQRMENEGRWRKAAELYGEVMQLMPSNQRAADGYRRAMDHLDEGPMIDAAANNPPTSGASSVQMRMRRQRQRTIVEFDEHMKQAHELSLQEKWAAAEQEVINARVVIKKGRQYLSQTDYDELDDQSASLQAKIVQDRHNAGLAQQQAAKEEQEAQAAQDEASNLRKKDRIVETRIRRARQLQAEMEYEEALALIDDALHFDPRNPTLLALREAVKQTMLLRKYADLARSKRAGVARLSVDQQEALQIPQANETDRSMPMSMNGILSYPPDWPQITEDRGDLGGYDPQYRSARFSGQSPPRDKEIRRALEDSKNAVPVDFGKDLAFRKGLDFIEETSGIKIYPDWPALNAMGIDDETTFENGLQLAKLPLNVVLDRMMESVGFEGDRPAWGVQDGMLVISSRDALQRRMVVVVYDVRDLTLPIPDFNDPPNLNLGGGGMGGGGGGGGFGGGGGGFGGGGGGFGG
ncbi:MAG: hypothetical protein MK101_10985, partial [Phycisphaerales bacterium]|nr:hypothetical protein [Phycisphaerales bacterium]